MSPISSYKVDLKCTMPATGNSYYRDHLPVLRVDLKKTQGGFATGDKVFVQLTAEKLQGLCAGHGEWNADMEKVRPTTTCFNSLTRA